MGGTISQATGGSFESGALNAAMGRLFNDISHPVRAFVTTAFTAGGAAAGGLAGALGGGVAGAAVSGGVLAIPGAGFGAAEGAAYGAGIGYVAANVTLIAADAIDNWMQSDNEISDEPIKYSNEDKLKDQMKQRGWTEEQIHEAMKTKGITAQGKNGPATRYVHPETGQSVVKDNTTGQIFHVGGKGYKSD